MKHYQKVPFSQVQLTDGFWKGKQKMVDETSIQSVYDRFSDTGRIQAFACNWKEGMPLKPHYFWDSDVAKWMESAAYIIRRTPRPDLEAKVDALVEQIIRNQEPCGYFNIYFQTVEPEERWKHRGHHELYCAGHLMEAAVAYYDATGKRAFLDAMCRYADYIADLFMERQGAAFVTPGHEEIELALIKLYHATGEDRYRRLAKFFIDKRGENPDESHAYDQSHLPVRRQTTAEGHAVRAVYLYSGMCDVADEYEDEELLAACETLFENIVTRRMYVSGGIGSAANGEQFTVDYDLPNKEAYSESCAAIGLAFFAQRMQRHFANARYADVIERILYNGFLSSVSLDGKAFFYENPLEIDLSLHERNRKMRFGRFPITQRLEVFGCSCCPPNITRFISSIGDYLYTYDDETLFVHQYMNSVATLQMNGADITITQQGNYPNGGTIDMQIGGLRGKLAVRIPGWCDHYTLNLPYTVKDGYAYVDIHEDTRLTLTLDMEPYFVAADPHVQNNAGRVAVMRGPVLYCMESVDNGGNLHGIVLHGDKEMSIVPDTGSGLVALDAPAYRMHAPSLYSRATSVQRVECVAHLIPYSAFANRGEADMLVWMNWDGR